MSSNLTHRKRIARALTAATGLPYARCQQAVAAAHDDDLLPPVLDDAGIAEAVRLLAPALLISEQLRTGALSRPGVADLPANAPTTAFSYMYRDASNYKQYATVVFAGRPDPRLVERAQANLEDGDKFLAEQIGLDNLRERWGSHYDDDHAWHEIGDDTLSAALEESRRRPTDPRTIDEFLAALADARWDLQASVERLQAWVASTPRGT